MEFQEDDNPTPTPPSLLQLQLPLPLLCAKTTTYDPLYEEENTAATTTYDPLYEEENATTMINDCAIDDASGESSESKFASGISLSSALFPFTFVSKQIFSGGGNGNGNPPIQFFTTGRAIPPSLINSIERVGVIPYVKFPYLYEGLLNTSEHAKTSTRQFMRFVPKAQQTKDFVGIPSSTEDDETSSSQKQQQQMIDIIQLHQEAASISRYWFAMAVDAQYGELTDCGGKRESFLEPIERTAARELYEESMGIFDFRKKECEILNSHTVTNGITCIFFVRIHPTVKNGFPYHLPHIFTENRRNWFSEATKHHRQTSSSASEVRAFRKGHSDYHQQVTTMTTSLVGGNRKRYPFRPPSFPYQHAQNVSTASSPPQPTLFLASRGGDFIITQKEGESQTETTSLLTTSTSTKRSNHRGHGSNAFFENSCMYWIPGSDLEKILEIKTKKINKKKYHISPIPFTRIPVESATLFSLAEEAKLEEYNDTEIELSKLIQLEKETGCLPKKKLVPTTTPASSTPTLSVVPSFFPSPSVIIKHPFMYETIRKLLYPIWNTFKDKL